MMKSYLYLASRNKKGIKLVATLETSKFICSRITSVADLSLPLSWRKQIEQIIYENRMLYEPWLETADNFQELKTRLEKKGYTVLSTTRPLLNLKDAPPVNIRSCNVVKSMIRKPKL